MNAITAGAVDTDIRVYGTTPELEASIVASVPLGRQASVDDVTALFAFLGGGHSPTIPHSPDESHSPHEGINNDANS